MELNFSKIEEKILKLWQENKIFEKLRKKNQGKKRWSFLDGPITANNPMGVHHAWGRTYKDVFQRYKAMQGFEQRFQNGFDCQGLWVEVEVEKELGFKNKKDIEGFGIDKFVEKCKERVRKYSQIQTQQSIRLGQWMDWENSYYTMSDENNYAIWGFLKKCWQDGNLYKERDSVPWCPRCGTAISQHEILTEEYKLITHKAIYLKLPILEGQFKGAKFLVWTTTPWTIPANVALAVNPELDYALYKENNEKLILAKALTEKILSKEAVLEKTFKGEELKRTKYESVFDDLPRVKKAREENPDTFHGVVSDKDLVTETEGTGIVHIAPGAGEEDFKLGQREKLPVIEVIDENALYIDGLAEFSGKNAKENPEIILNYIKQHKNGEFFYKLEDYEHRYPTCWRCKTELVWRVVDERYISMDKLRKPLMEVAKTIKWIPDFGLERELDWLKNMQDWLISKKRYWGLALPIFECECGNFEVIGSKEELKQKAVEGWENFNGHSPHRPWVDKVKIKCLKCGKTIPRILDVGNPWLDAGIVPFSTMEYYKDKEYWKKWFPADLVCESFPGQFKNWFYSILVMSTVLENVSPVKTIFGYALVRDEKGEEMHKSKGNTIWLDDAVENMGVDVMRWMYSRQNPVHNLNFGYKAGQETKRKLLNLWNSFVFFKTYVEENEMLDKDSLSKSNNLLDVWILSRFNNLIKEVGENLDGYNAFAASSTVEKFFTEDLSLWYIRRSRQRFQKPKNKNEKGEATETLYFVLLNLTKLIAPMMPFFAEEIYQNLKTKNMPESVHLCNWPEADKKMINLELEEKMEKVREIVSLALAERVKAKIKVKQPLNGLQITNQELKNEPELLDLIKEEVNVKKITFGKTLKLNREITPELKKEGEKREIVRIIKDLRKRKSLSPNLVIANISSTASIVPQYMKEEEFKKEAGAEEFIKVEKKDEMTNIKEIELEGKKHYIGIKKE